jgi:hypothetical protein
MVIYCKCRIMEGRKPPSFGRARRTYRESPSTADFAP